jgi:nucleoside-diphosphate-sugar epimerase
MVPVQSVFRPRFVLPAKGDLMTTSILVTGGTGTLGRPVAQRLRDAGASVTVLSRRGDWGNRQPQRRDDRRSAMRP